MTVKEKSIIGSIIAVGAHDDRTYLLEGADARVEGQGTLVTPKAAHMMANC